jgi:hypothetical protein
MKSALIKVAKLEAERFLQRVKEYEKTTACLPNDDNGYLAPIASGSLRRSSLDLTRALANMRRPS